MSFDNSNYWEEDDDNSCFIEKNCVIPPKSLMEDYIIPMLNTAREKYLATKDKKFWWQMIQLLPSSYNQRRTVMLNYEVLTNIFITPVRTISLMSGRSIRILILMRRVLLVSVFVIGSRHFLTVN